MTRFLVAIGVAALSIFGANQQVATGAGIDPNISVRAVCGSVLIFFFVVFAIGNLNASVWNTLPFAFPCLSILWLPFVRHWIVTAGYTFPEFLDTNLGALVVAFLAMVFGFVLMWLRSGSPEPARKPD
jgi:hypothetical protein